MAGARRGLAAWGLALVLGGCTGAPAVERVTPDPPLPGQVAVDPGNPRWLRIAPDRPFFLCGPGDPEGFLYRGILEPDGTRSGDQMELIRKLAPTGANAIYLMAVRSHGGDGDRTENPFVDHDPAKGLSPAILDQWERWFAEMDRHGIVIFFFLYDDETLVWDTGDEVGPAEKAFVDGLVDRFEHHRNLIWVVAEEYEERLSPLRVRRLAAEIRRADDHDHPIAVHKLSGLDFQELADDPNIDQFAIQYNVPTVRRLHQGVLTAWRRAEGRYNLNLAEAKPWGRGADARHRAWAVALGGAYVMGLGQDIATTPVSDLEDCGRLVRFFESTDFRSMAPRDDLAAGETRYALAHPGESYILYSDRGSGPLGVEGLTAGRYELRWLDTVSGREVEEERGAAAGRGLWPRPAGIGEEAALYVKRMVPGGG